MLTDIVVVVVIVLVVLVVALEEEIVVIVGNAQNIAAALIHTTTNIQAFFRKLELEYICVHGLQNPLISMHSVYCRFAGFRQEAKATPFERLSYP